MPKPRPKPRPKLPDRDAVRDRELVEALVAWFDTHQRDLPWRRDRAPYAVWVSEIMLQQTRVETVIPYFERFLSRFPDARALATAELDEVLHLWSGLGYYRRARQLHATAREVTSRYGGKFPRDAETLRSLPGVGAYTAGAIASIAYGAREPLVDGNVARVLSRIEGITDPIKSPAALARLWSLAGRLVPEDRPGRFNEALMELGATVCTPREPRCSSCPLASCCVAHGAGREREIPVVSPKPKVPEVHVVAAVLVDDRGRALFGRRRADGLFGGLWEPPMVEPASTLVEARGAFAAMGLPLGRGRLSEVGRVKRVLSHRRMIVTVVVGERRAKRDAKVELGPPYEAAAWLDVRDPKVGVSTLARSVLAVASKVGHAERD
jgi:A/G-specific adenine glycosylase